MMFSTHELNSGDGEIMEKEACLEILNKAEYVPLLTALEREK